MLLDLLVFRSWQRFSEDVCRLLGIVAIAYVNGLISDHISDPMPMCSNVLRPLVKLRVLCHCYGAIVVSFHETWCVLFHP
jgi:hypothetical protein